MPARRRARSSLPDSPATSPSVRSPWRRHRPVSDRPRPDRGGAARRRLRHARRTDRRRGLRRPGPPRPASRPGPAPVGVSPATARVPEPDGDLRSGAGPATPGADRDQRLDRRLPGLGQLRSHGPGVRRLRSGRSRAQHNVSRFCDPQLDAAVDRARTAGTPMARPGWRSSGASPRRRRSCRSSTAARSRSRHAERATSSSTR